MCNIRKSLFGCIVIVLAVTVTSAHAVDGIEASVVKLNVTKREPDFFKPWTKASLRRYRVLVR